MVRSSKGEASWPQIILLTVGILGSVAISFRERSFANMEKAVRFFDEGTRVLVQSQNKEAETLYRQSLNAFPRFANAHLGLARVYKLQGESERAIYELNRAIELYPSSSRGWYDPHRMMVEEAYEQRADLMEAMGNREAADKDRGIADAMTPFLDLFSGWGRYWQVSQTKEYDRYSNTLNSEQFSNLPQP